MHTSALYSINSINLCKSICDELGSNYADQYQMHAPIQIGHIGGIKISPYLILKLVIS